MKSKTQLKKRDSLPDSFDQLVRMMPPMAIHDDVQHDNMIDIVDRLMQIEKLTQGQSDYLETLVELVEAYEGKRHAIDVSNIGGIRMLKHLLTQSGTSRSELARLLNIHPTMGSKILKGNRRLTWDHAKILGHRFKVSLLCSWIEVPKVTIAPTRPGKFKGDKEIRKFKGTVLNRANRRVRIFISRETMTHSLRY